MFDSQYKLMVIRLDPGGRRVKNRIRTGNVAAFIPENSAYNHASSVESISLVAGGEPMGRCAAVQGWPFALVHACAANTHQGGITGMT